MSNPPSTPEDSELNIVRYVLNEESLPIPSSQVVLGPDLQQGLIQHIDTETTVLPPASGGHQSAVAGLRRLQGCPSAWTLPHSGIFTDIYSKE